jgi:hypothetical protein
MADHDIITSQSLLKELEERMYSLYKLVSEIDIVIFNLKQTWTALSVTHGNFKRDAKED